MMHLLALAPFFLFILPSIVYVDTSRRDLSRRSVWPWTIGVGSASTTSFHPLVFKFNTGFVDVYYHIHGGSPDLMPATTTNLLYWNFELYLVSCALLLLLYGVGSRFGPLKSQKTA